MRSAGAPTPSSHRSRRFALATVIPIAMLCVAQLLFAAVSRSATTATTFRPVADSSIYQAHPSANYGTKTTLRKWKHWPSFAGQIKPAPRGGGLSGARAKTASSLSPRI